MTGLPSWALLGLFDPAVYYTTVGIKLKFPFRLHKLHIERNFGVKITFMLHNCFYVNVDFNFSLPRAVQHS